MRRRRTAGGEDVTVKAGPSRIVPVLLYHSVSDHPSQDEPYAVSRAMFEAHAAVIAASGRATVRISDLARALRGEKSLPPRVAAITFDDGFDDNHEAILTLLDMQLRSTLYVTTGPLGTAHRLTHSQVTQLAHMPGVEVGAHAVHHRYLDELHDRELVEEVGSSKHELEDLIGRPIRSFAYPHGAYDSRVRQAVMNAGYQSAAAVKNALSHLGDDPFAIARLTVTADTNEERIAELLEGRHVPVAWSRERVRTRAYRTVRRTRMRVAGMLTQGDVSGRGGAGSVEAS
jgi:peptidoglycan/xylan/chitin deacetylase (PgdA/CDA1 family)